MMTVIIKMTKVVMTDDIDDNDGGSITKTTDNYIKEENNDPRPCGRRKLTW